MGMRTVTMTLVITLAVWIFAAPMLTGCGDEAVSDSNTNSVENVRRSGTDRDMKEAGSGYILMDMIKKGVVEVLGENYWPDRQLTEEELEAETGIGRDMYDEYLAEKQNVETDIDMMIIIKAKPEQLAGIETLLNEYRDSLMVKYKERPQELGKVVASRIEIIDSYICFVQLGADTAAAALEGDEEVIAHCQHDNEQAVDMVERTIFEALLIQADG